MWPLAALGWILMFAASRTLLFAVVFPLVPLSAMKLPALFEAFPALEGWHVVAFGVAAWLLFGIWYLRTGRIAPPSGQHMNLAAAGTASPAFIWMLDRKESGTDTTSPALATFHNLMGTASYRLFVVTGAWTGLVFIAVSLVTPTPRSGANALLLFMLPFMSVQCAVMAFTTARRARLLWLRTGMDRNHLFHLADKLALRASLATWGIVAGLALAFMLVSRPDDAMRIVLFVGAQGVVAICMHYVGLTLVRDGDVSDVLLGIVSLALLLLQMVLAQPGGDIPSRQPLITLATAVALLLPLRWYAHRRWRAIDWRLIRPSTMDLRRSGK
jgi:hypothetical protein